MMQRAIEVNDKARGRRIEQWRTQQPSERPREVQCADIEGSVSGKQPRLSVEQVAIAAGDPIAAVFASDNDGDRLRGQRTRLWRGSRLGTGRPR